MLTINDLKNMMIVLHRAQFQGLSEAEVGTVLAHKITGMIRAAEAPQVAPNGPNVPNNSEPSPSPVG